MLKKLDIIREIKESGLLEYLQNICMPDAIILFGSASRGEDVKGSDIDLYLQCPERKLDLSKFRINSFGLYFGKIENSGIRLSIPGTQLIGKSADKNIIEIDKKLIQMPNVVVTAHMAYNSREARSRILETNTDNIKKFLEGNIQNAV